MFSDKETQDHGKSAGEQSPSESSQVKKGKKDKVMKIKESEYTKLVNAAEEYKDKYLRLFAEFDNVRKRTERERAEFVKYATEELIVEFLGILDDLERSVQAAQAKHEDYEAFQKGIELVMARVHELLKKNDVSAIEAVGKAFDPHYHEALMQVETNDHDDGVIVEEFQKGYLLGERVVRTAKVKVAKKKESAANIKK